MRGEDGARNGRVSTVRAITAARRCVEVADMTAAVSGGAVRGDVVNSTRTLVHGTQDRTSLVNLDSSRGGV